MGVFCRSSLGLGLGRWLGAATEAVFERVSDFAAVGARVCVGAARLTFSTAQRTLLALVIGCMARVACGWLLAIARDVANVAAVGAQDGRAFCLQVICVAAVVASLDLDLLRAVFGDVTGLAASVASL